MQLFRPLFFIVVLLIPVLAISIPMENKIYSEYIKTVQLYPTGYDMALPVIGLNTGETLELRFDDISGKPKNYFYTILQCHSDWTPTAMNIMEYIDGYSEANINDYQLSNGTKTNYVHYTMKLPNTDMKINRSGNYLLIVYETNKDNPIFTRRFMINESKVVIDAGVAYPRNMSLRDKYQEVVFKVNYKGFSIDNPPIEIKSTVLQNYRWDNAKLNITPQFTGINELNFDFNGTLTFPALGREFRFFDLRSLRFRGQNIRSFDITENTNNVFLTYDYPQPPFKYQFIKDLNGQFYIENLDNPYYNTGADYANVHFTLDFGSLINNGNFYVIGAFNNWTCDEQSKMQYDPMDKGYAATISLKQGNYNYSYIFKDENGATDQFLTEGYFMDTENDYTILLYYTPFGERYDRLISVKHINSLLNRY